MIRCCNVLSAALVLLLGAGAVSAQEAVLLRYKMDENDKLAYRTTTTMKQTQNFAGQTLQTEFTQSDVSLRTLEKVDEKGNFTLKTENKRLLVKGDLGPAGTYTFDSTSNERARGNVVADAVNPLFDRLSGAILSVTISPRGEVVDAKGYEELIGDIVKDNPVAAQFAGGGSDKAFKMGIAENFAQFAEQPVKPGDKWEVPYEVELPKLGKAQGKRIYTYVGPDKVGERPTAKIDVVHELAFDLDVDSAGTKVTGKLSIDKSSGTVHFDPEKGQLVSLKHDYVLSGDISVETNGNTIPVKTEQNQSSTVELLDKLP